MMILSVAPVLVAALAAEVALAAPVSLNHLLITLPWKFTDNYPMIGCRRRCP